jgi:hypothetical protein
MKPKGQDSKEKKSISNLEEQRINADNVQGGLKISYEELIREHDGFTATRTDEETLGRKPPSKNPFQKRKMNRK